MQLRAGGDAVLAATAGLAGPQARPRRQTARRTLRAATHADRPFRPARFFEKLAAELIGLDHRRDRTPAAQYRIHTASLALDARRILRLMRHPLARLPFQWSANGPPMPPRCDRRRTAELGSDHRTTGVGMLGRVLPQYRFDLGCRVGRSRGRRTCRWSRPVSVTAGMDPRLRDRQNGSVRLHCNFRNGRHQVIEN